MRADHEIQVLLIEDSDERSLLLFSLLSGDAQFRFELIRTRQLSEAIEFLGRGRADVVVADASLPDLRDSGEALESLLRNKTLPLIVLTDTAEREDAVRIFRHSTDLYLSKNRLADASLSSKIMEALWLKETEAASGERDGSFRQAADHAPVMIWECDTDGEFVFFNETWMDFRGKKLRSESAALFRQDIHPDDLLRYQRTFDAAVAARQCFRLEYRLLGRDGKYHWIMDMATPRHHRDGRYDGLMGSSVDITERKKVEAESEEWKSRYQVAIEASRQVLLDWNPAAGQMILGGNVRQILGHGIEDLNGKIRRWLKLVHPADRRNLIQQLRYAQWSKGYLRAEYRVRHRDGHYLHIEHYAKMINGLTGGRGRLVGFAADVSERKKKDRELRERETKFRTLVANIPGAVYRYRYESGIGWNLEFFSEEIEKLAGLPAEHFLEGDIEAFTRLVWEEDRGIREEAIRKAFESRESFEVRFRIRRQDGQVRWVHEQGRVVSDEKEGTLWLDGVLFDATERTLAEERVNYLAYYDSLTGLPNRFLFMDRLSQALRQFSQKKQPLAVFSLDMDHFKRINDTMGHEAGNALILMVSERLQREIYETDTLTRFWGDEFLMLVKDLKDAPSAAKIADRILGIFEKPFWIGGEEIFIGCSVGISFYPNDGYDAESLLKNAETAKNRSKEHGGQQYRMYSPEMNDRAMKQLRLEGDLRRAVENEELRVYYQPQLDLKTSRVTGMEALLRWFHPEMGAISPGEFIPVAEECGLIVPIGRWVIRSVCQQIREWILLGVEPVRVSVNLSIRQFRQKDFAVDVMSILEAEGIHPGLIEFEITEAVMKDDAETVATLGALKERGIRISVDDFGTGYSSLSRLKRFPLHSLKIDGSFVGDIRQDTNDTAIAEAIISMAHSLDLEVVAEGVETKHQLEFLKKYGCDKVQGFLFSRAIAPNEVASFLNRVIEL